MQNFWPYIAWHWRSVVDLSTFAVCAVLIGAYQIRLRRHIRLDPALTMQGMNFRARAAWIERVMTEDHRDVMAVQTLRNSIMAATLMATTAVLLIFGILNLLGNSGKIGATFHGLNAWGSHEEGISTFKLMLLIVDFFVAFFAFSLAVRGYHHASYLINVPPAGQHGVTPAKIMQVLNRASRYYFVGMRAYYFSVPLVLWLFGPVWMFGATLVLLAVLNHLDHLSD